MVPGGLVLDGTLGGPGAFGFAVPAPPTDAAQPGMVSPCPKVSPVAAPERFLRLKFTTPGHGRRRRKRDVLTSWRKKVKACRYIDAQLRVRVEACVKNEGSATASSVYVCITAGGHSTEECNKRNTTSVLVNRADTCR